MKSIGEYLSLFQLDSISNRLDIGEPRYNLRELGLEKVTNNFEQVTMRYVEAKGNPELRKQIVIHLLEERQEIIDEDNILICNGATGGLFSSLKSVVSTNDKVLVFTPAWPNYFSMIHECGGIAEIEKIDLNSEVWQINLERLKKIEGLKAIILNTPNNPTGKVPYAKDLIRLLQYCHSEKIYLIFDEAYYELIFDNAERTAFWHLDDYIICVRTFSKFYCMPGLRVGYIFSTKNTIQRICHTQHHCINCIGILEQLTAAVCMRNNQDFFISLAEKYREKIMIAKSILEQNSKIKCVYSCGGFFLFVHINGINAEFFSHYLAENYSTMVIPGTIFGKDMQEYIRISCVNLDGFEDGVKKILYAVNNLEANGEL